MERLRRLTEFWNWLPAFRAVAESAHLQTASKDLCVSPSSLSRTIHLLENNLGKKLFDRQGRNIQLNQNGEMFLTAVRDAMRLVDEGVATVTSQKMTNSFHISTVGMITEVTLPAIRQLQKDQLNLICHLYHYPSSKVNSLLLKGRLDIAMLQDPTPHPQLIFEEIGTTTNSIYCGKGHPLFNIKRPSMRTILQHPFAALNPELTGAPADNWPIHLKRRVHLYLTHLRAAVDICAGGSLLVVLPDPIIQYSSSKEKLRRLPINCIPSTCFYAVRRQAILSNDLSQLFIADLKKRLKRFSSRQSSR